MTKNNDDVRAAHLISNIELGTGGKVEKTKPEIQAVQNPDCTSLNVPEYALKTGLKVVPDYDDILQYAERLVCGDLSDIHLHLTSHRDFSEQEVECLLINKARVYFCQKSYHFWC